MTDTTFTKDTMTMSGKTFPVAYTVNEDKSITVTAQVGEKAVAIQINQDHPLHAAAMAAASTDAASAQEEKPEEDKAKNHFNPDKQAHGPVPEKTWIGTSIQGIGWRIEFCPVFDRTRVIFDRMPTKEAREMVKAAGFAWSPNMGSWNKKLTWKAYRAAQELSKSLASMDYRAC